MRKLLLIILISLFGYINLLAQSNKTNIKELENMLIGTWKVDTIYLKTELNLGAYYELYVEKFREIKDLTSFIFEKNKSYSNKTLKGLEKNGKWRISPDGKKIIVRLENTGKDETSKIELLSNDSLIISPLEESSNSKVVLYKFVEND
ncbi:MAG: DUF5004 domain-containing protein [Bacteroidales bacterium]|jgi:hypothetical protein|nr:DUF5004 domain-containing protein [Bacteroidales bacterium]